MRTMSQQSPPVASRRWLGLAVIGVALPKMQTDLGFSPENLSWVFNAYVVALGGLLLLGGTL